MTASFRNAAPVVALMAYLSSVIIGGLHYHEHGETSANHHSDISASPLAGATIQSSSPIISVHDDGDGCTLCTALHQAKSLPIAIAPITGMALAGEADSIPVHSPIAPVPLIQQARAPPFMS